ncbi:hypothetical protein [Thalassospira xiamenensis]|uniref:Uncharacterized protein n=1 Tax=Thalassospira xiamenensis TaxID=220697 RepID=A0A285TM20_9PROT|nr:hypothetical protein [Thalassospira xiamenensis]SOC21531.1 hypothetical protein SAMN05428964_103431 [Thalassospira xiamenensis]
MFDIPFSYDAVFVRHGHRWREKARFRETFEYAPCIMDAESLSLVAEVQNVEETDEVVSVYAFGNRFCRSLKDAPHGDFLDALAKIEPSSPIIKAVAREAASIQDREAPESLGVVKSSAKNGEISKIKRFLDQFLMVDGHIYRVCPEPVWGVTSTAARVCFPSDKLKVTNPEMYFRLDDVADVKAFMRVPEDPQVFASVRIFNPRHLRFAREELQMLKEIDRLILDMGSKIQLDSFETTHDMFALFAELRDTQKKCRRKGEVSPRLRQIYQDAVAHMTMADEHRAASSLKAL